MSRVCAGQRARTGSLVATIRRVVPPRNNLPALLGRCTHKIAIDDSDLINVRIGPLCELKSDISQVREVPHKRPRADAATFRARKAEVLNHLIGTGERARRDSPTEDQGAFLPSLWYSKPSSCIAQCLHWLM